MTIRKGQDWGQQGRLPDDGVVVRSDAEAAAVVTEARRTKRPIPVLGLLGGDLARALGSSGNEARLHSDDARQVAIDLGSVLVDGELHWFVAHLVARRRWWSGPFVVAMNADYLGPWKMAPRAHPNDGRLDLLEGSLSLDDRLKARSRLRTGDHLPHPGIRTRQVTAAQFDLARGTQVHLDGRHLGGATHLSIRVEPDAVRCVV